jgi:hypothetical protein
MQLIQNKTRIIKVKIFEANIPNHYNNQPDIMKMNDSYSNFLASPFDVHLSVNMSINIRVGTIPMVCSSLLEIVWNNQEVNSVHSVQNWELKQIVRSGNLRRNKVLFIQEGDDLLDKVTKEIY